MDKKRDLSIYRMQNAKDTLDTAKYAGNISDIKTVSIDVIMLRFMQLRQY